MIRDLLTSLFVIGLIQAVVPYAPQTPGAQPPGNQPPANVSDDNTTPLKPLTPDPAAILFTTPLGLVLVPVKAANVADYEAAIVALQEALAKATDEETRKLAQSWRVFKARELDAKANPLYVHMLMPTAEGVDYRPSLWLDQLLAGAPPELLAKYRDAFAGPPSKLALAEFANMAVAPIAKPTNASPDAPVGNASPAKPGNQPPASPSGKAES